MTRTMLALLVLCVPALARDNGQYNSVAPEAAMHLRSEEATVVIDTMNETAKDSEGLAQKKRGHREIF